MTFIRKEGRNYYIVRRFVCKNDERKKYKIPYKNWWLIKYKTKLQLGDVFFPEKLAGKKIKIRIEILEEK